MASLPSRSLPSRCYGLQGASLLHLLVSRAVMNGQTLTRLVKVMPLVIVLIWTSSGVTRLG